MKYLNLFLSGYSVKLCVLRDPVKIQGYQQRMKLQRRPKKNEDLFLHSCILKLDVFVSTFNRVF